MYKLRMCKNIQNTIWIIRKSEEILKARFCVYESY